MKIFKAILAVAVISTVCFSCATVKSDAYLDMDSAVRTNADYEKAITIIEAQQAVPEGKKKAAEPLYVEKNKVLLQLDKGLLEHYAEKYGDSSKDLEEGERLIEEGYTKSVTADVASYIANDNTKDYAGEIYENLYVNVFNALNYYNNGDLEGAGVEVRKVTEKLEALEDSAGSDSGKVMDWVKSQIGDLNPDFPKVKSLEIRDSALARYLSAIIYIRQGRYFPGKAYVGGISLDPGKHTVVVNYYGASGKIVGSKKTEIDAKAGGLNLVEAVSLK